MFGKGELVCCVCGRSAVFLGGTPWSVCVCVRACVRSCTSLSSVVGGGVLAPRGGDPRPHSVPGPGVGVLRPSITRSAASEADITVSRRLGSQILSSSFPPEPSPPALAP